MHELLLLPLALLLVWLWQRGYEQRQRLEQLEASDQELRRAIAALKAQLAGPPQPAAAATAPETGPAAAATIAELPAPSAPDPSGSAPPEPAPAPVLAAAPTLAPTPTEEMAAGPGEPAAPGQDPAQPPGAQTPEGGGGELGSGLTTGSAPEETETSGTSTLANGTRITPNPANNTLVIRATPKEYRKIQAMLRQIDAPAVQVLINTTIAEVALTDELRYGVQAYFKGQDTLGGFFGGEAPGPGAPTSVELGPNLPILKPVLPGLNFLVGRAADPRLVIDALSSITNVRVVSSPSVLVLENETATIKVGDQVPVKTLQSTTDTGTNNDSFEYRDTGVILKVKPRVSANGVVTIDLGQELSAVSKRDGATAGNNPTISQRTITSKVSVNDRQTVLLGGLITGQEERDKKTVPGTNRVPLIGDLIGSTAKGAKRTELIVFITPKIIRNGEEASRESQDLRDKMRNLTFN